MKCALGISEARRRRRERFFIASAAVLICLLSFAEYSLLRGSLRLPQGGNFLIFAIINFNTLLLLLLSFLIVRNLVKLIFEDRQNVLGAKLRTKLVVAFVSLSLVPTVVLFLASWQFLSTSLNYWFDVKMERSLEDAMTVGRAYYEERVSRLQNIGDGIGQILVRRCLTENNSLDRACLEEWSSPAPFSLPSNPSPPNSAAAFNSVEVFLPTHERILFHTTLPLIGHPPHITASVLMKALEGQRNLVYTTPLQPGELIRVLRPLVDGEQHVVAVLALGGLISHEISGLLEGIRTGYEDYRQLRLFQDPIKITLLTTLFLITLLILFAATWFGFRLAKGITEPVRMLAEATHRVASGDLDFTLEAEGRDELSSLVRAFNTMTQDLKDASRQLHRSNVELEQRRRYMEIILQNVAAGVISVDRQGIVTTMNRSAEVILAMAADHAIGQHYTQLLTPEQVGQFESIRQELALSPRGTLQRPIRMVVGDKTLSLLVSFTLLRDQEGRSLGVVVVFDDLTELERIQRLAAWREVARRIAHEVKNPLTPIQLSAERLRKRYLDRFDAEGRAVLDRCTRTIITQVDELKRLVKEFSDFARMPTLNPRPTRLEALAEEVMVLYGEGHPNVRFSLHSSGSPPEIPLDPNQIKRSLINLIDNAVASMPEGGDVKVSVVHNPAAREVHLIVADTGQGVTPEDRSRLFEPYFSTKKSGTGLGLTIVNSIVANHNGRILVEDNQPHGTRFILIFPVGP